MRFRSLVSLATVAALAAGCSVEIDLDGPTESSDALGDDAVTVGSFNFGESVLLGELYAQALEARGLRVVRAFNLGPRELVEPALEKGLLEVVPEYAGSLLGFLPGGVVGQDLSAVREDLSVALAGRGLTLLASAPAQDRNGFAVTETVARELGLDEISDLADHAALVLGGPPECPQRELCGQGLEAVYGIEFDSFVPLDQSGPLTADALVRGVVDVALMFTTSAEIVRNGLVLLRDDRDLQPPENVTPVARRDTAERFGTEFTQAIDAVSALLTTEELRALNAEVEIDGRSAAAVAGEWLVAHGLVPDGG